MNRRGFLKLIGAAAAGAALPSAIAGELVARAPSWAKDVVLFSCTPLEAGLHTFSAYVRRPGEAWTLFMSSVEAKGGETVIEVPLKAPYTLKEPVLGDGLTAHLDGWAESGGSFDLHFAQLERKGDQVTPYEPARTNLLMDTSRPATKGS